jgi:hypothetical protein
LHLPDNLNNINVHGWANNEIVRIVRESHQEIVWALDSKKNHTQLPVFLKLYTTVDYGSLVRHSLGSVRSSCEISRKGNRRLILHPI